MEDWTDGWTREKKKDWEGGQGLRFSVSLLPYLQAAPGCQTGRDRRTGRADRQTMA